MTDHREHEFGVLSVSTRCIRDLAFALPFALAAGLYSHGVMAREVVATPSVSAVLGKGYRPDKSEFTGLECVTGTTTEVGNTRGSIGFEQRVSERELSEQLGMNAGGRTRFGLATASFAAKFLRATASNQFSVSVIYVAETQTPTKQLTGITKVAAGTSPQVPEPTSSAWRTSCGTEFVEKIIEGGRIYLSIKVTFSSTTAKEEFEAETKLNIQVTEIVAKITNMKSSLAKEASITVSAYQVGGDSTKLSTIMGTNSSQDPSSPLAIVQCGFGNPRKCEDAINIAIKYAADPTSGFPSQLGPTARPGPAPLIYVTQPYNSVNIVPSVQLPWLDDANALALGSVQRKFELLLDQLRTADALLALRLDSAHRSKVTDAKNAIESNLSEIQRVAEMCFTDDGSRCQQRLNALQLRSIDPDALQLPPPPKGSFRLWTVGRGTWTRAESLAEMWRRSLEIQNAELSSRQGNPYFVSSAWRILSFKDDPQFRDASIVIKLEGEGISSAEFQVAGVSIGSSLTFADFPEKSVSGGKLVVVDSLRQTRGWIDVDVGRDVCLAALVSPIGSGKYVLVVSDQFGRRTPIELAYVKWSVGTFGGGGPMLLIWTEWMEWDRATEGVGLADSGERWYKNTNVTLRSATDDQGNVRSSADRCNPISMSR